MSAPHVNAVPQEARPYQGRAAGVVSRTLASVIDAAVVSAVLIGGFAGLNAVLFVVDPRDYQVVAVSPLASGMAWLTVLVLYLSAAWSLTGRTYGSHVMGLRLVTMQGGDVHTLVAVTRALLCAVFPVGLFWCAFDSASRSVQDHLLRTSVVYDWRPGAQRGPLT